MKKPEPKFGNAPHKELANIYWELGVKRLSLRKMEIIEMAIRIEQIREDRHAEAESKKPGFILGTSDKDFKKVVRYEG